MGNISQRVARMMKAAFGTTVYGYDPFVEKEEAEKRGFIKCEKLEELLEAQPEETELRQAVETLRDSARWQAAHWQTWSVAAWRGQ